ncbi:branched-chain amino acid ABC transporter permease [Nonomuraea gerenzanensis]|uniref:Branched-chain amino acid transport system permease protein LivM (TC 3.A.1.4.1) n=1 Tax=Nonomuraea gerenzanensis TaxID=93944 RepID=A0A1M4DVZ5_9ACTN|nr:branched-chain amino acid ABC transporter permease [Nonomuraea gerenzanensis]UBU13086.1 branched-chain amino acid ABC transporter permease [Nonomuraea gerenzanensis]SBO90728.1 Branched-chain amino acid transport system permease protein LivM (TC 3.A.1.4.1) [Nonomuraea gerenzanensis]
MSSATKVEVKPVPVRQRRKPDWKWAALGLLLAAALYAPFQLVPFHVFQLTMVLVYAVALLGLNLLVGHAGQISLGHGAFFAVGAYAAAILMDRWALPYPLTLPIAAAVAFLLGLALGVPAMRLRGLYLALVTLAIAIFLVPLLKRFEELTGGSMGLTLPKPAPPAWSGLAEDQWLYFLTLAVTVAAFLLAASLLRSRVGRALHAIRDNEAAAEVMGVRLSFYKTLAFAWSAMFAGAAGCVYTWVIGFVSPDSFTVNLSITLLAGLVVGGLGSLSGPVLGGLFVMFVPSISQDVNDAAPGVIFGLLIIAVMYVAPTGLAGLAGRLIKKIPRKE